MNVNIFRIGGVPAYTITGEYTTEVVNGYERYICSELNFTKFGKHTLYKSKKGEKYIDKKLPDGTYLRVIVRCI